MAVGVRGGSARQSEAAFTMVEIAISLAIIAFALVAIIGVLPIGLDVQKENRQETIINQDAGYFMDAIRNGARGLDDLTNYVIGITNYWTTYNTSSIPWAPTGRDGEDGYDVQGSVVTSPQVNPSRPQPFFPLTNGYRIIGLLARPKFEYIEEPGSTYYQSNYVVAFVRALSGSAVEKFPQTNDTVLRLAFSYRMIPEVVPVPGYDTNSAYGKNLQANLNELRLLFRWPLLPNWSAGNGRQVYRALVSGQLTNFNDMTTGQKLYFFQPTTFVNAP